MQQGSKLLFAGSWLRGCCRPTIDPALAWRCGPGKRKRTNTFDAAQSNDAPESDTNRFLRLGAVAHLEHPLCGV